MDQAHLHMLTNHTPIIGTLFALLALAFGMFRKQTQIIILGYWFIIISVIGGLFAFYTGEAAEELVEGMQGVSDKVIHDHEEAGEVVMGFLYATGIAALLALVLDKMKKFQSLAAMTVLLLGLGLFGTSARAGYLGGQIRHTELHPATGNDVNQINQNDEYLQEYEDKD